MIEDLLAKNEFCNLLVKGNTHIYSNFKPNLGILEHLKLDFLLKDTKIHIYFSHNPYLYKELKNVFDKSHDIRSPKEFEYIKKYGEGLFGPQLKTTFFIQDQDKTIMFKSYFKDDFFIEYTLGKPEVYVIGAPLALRNTLSDIILASRKISPIHAAAIQKGSKAYLTLADSKTGKTSLTIDAVIEGYNILSDETSILEKQKLIPFVETLYLDDDYINYRPELKQLVKNKKNTTNVIDYIDFFKHVKGGLGRPSKISKVIFLTKETFKGGDTIKTMCNPFPVEVRNSLWCLPVIKGDKWEEFYKKMVKRTYETWDNITKKSIILDNFDISSKESRDEYSRLIKM